jgi:hypothetical protein
MALSGPTLRGTFTPATSGTTITTGSFTPTADSILIVGDWFDQDGLPSISDSLGGSWTPIEAGYRDDDGQFGGFGFWYQVVGGSPSSMTVTVTKDSGNANGGWVLEWTGQHTSAPIGATAKSSFSSGASNPIQQAITTGADNSVVVGGLTNWDTTSGSTADTGDTLDYESQYTTHWSGGMVGHITSAVSPAGSATIGFNRQTVQERGHIVAFELKEDAGGGGLSAVGDEIQLVWDTLAAVGDTTQLVWDTKAAVGDTVQLVWDTLISVGDETQLVWDTLAAVGDTIELVWNVRAAVGDETQLVWNVLSAVAAVGDEVQLVWNVRAAVSDQTQLVWNTRAAVGDQTQLVWNTLQAVGDETELQWAVLTAVGDEVELPWNVRAAVGDVVQLIWNTQSNIAGLIDHDHLSIPIGGGLYLTITVA